MALDQVIQFVACVPKIQASGAVSLRSNCRPIVKVAASDWVGTSEDGLQA